MTHKGIGQLSRVLSRGQLNGIDTTARWKDNSTGVIQVFPQLFSFFFRWSSQSLHNARCTRVSRARKRSSLGNNNNPNKKLKVLTRLSVPLYLVTSRNAKWEATKFMQKIWLAALTVQCLRSVAPTIDAFSTANFQIAMRLFQDPGC